MNEQTRDLLISAYRRKSLAAVHIDLQNLYLYNNNDTFKSVAELAGSMRQWDIPNAWVTFPIDLRGHLAPDANYKMIPPGITTVGDFNKTALAGDHDWRSTIPDLAGALPHEDVIVKDWGSAFHPKKPSYLHTYLQENKIDTVVFSGVDVEACLGRTLNDGTALERYDFVVAEDCINNRYGIPYKAYLLQNGVKDFDTKTQRQIRQPIKNNDAFQRHFHEATSESILEALKSTCHVTVPAMPPPVLSAIQHSLALPNLSYTAMAPAPTTQMPPLPVAAMSQELAAAKNAPPAP